MDVKNINLLELVGILGAAVMVIGVFLTWGVVDITAVIGDRTMEWSGWDIYQHVDGISTDADYAPLIALVCGILALITAIVPMFLGNEKYSDVFKILNLVVTVLGIIAVICMAVFYSGFVDSVGIEGMVMSSADVGGGFWLCMIGGIITVVGGILPIVNKLLS